MADYDFLLPDEWDSTWDEVMSPSPCECPTGPRQFLIPPPPPPPAMGVCGGSPLGGDRGDAAGRYFCHLEPMGAEFTQAGFPSLPVIAVCSSVVVVAVLVATFLIWRHKTKVQNLLPCKHEHHHPPGGHCDLTGTGQNGVTYEDVLINHHPTRLPLAGPPMVGGQTLMPMELLDVKLGDMVPPDSTALHPGSYYPTCRSNAGRIVSAKPFHPMYEEISREPSAGRKSATSKSYDSDVEESGRGGRSFTSEDDFAEDELSGIEYPSGEGSRHCSATSSVQGSTGGDLCKDPVSSDDAAGEDCDGYPHQPQQPGIMMAPHPQNTTFGYPSKQMMNMRAGDQLNRIPNNAPPQHNTFHPVAPGAAAALLPHDERKKQQFGMLPGRVGGGGNNNSNTNNFAVPSGPAHQSGSNWPVYPPPVCNVVTPHDSRESLDSPVENIYSTIDEGDVVQDIGRRSPITPNPSRAHVVVGGQTSKRSNPAAAAAGPPPSSKKLSNASKLLKQGEVNKRFQDEEDSESYGDIMPAYDATSCIT